MLCSKVKKQDFKSLGTERKTLSRFNYMVKNGVSKTEGIYTFSIFAEHLLHARNYVTRENPLRFTTVGLELLFSVHFPHFIFSSGVPLKLSPVYHGNVLGSSVS